MKTVASLEPHVLELVNGRLVGSEMVSSVVARVTIASSWSAANATDPDPLADPSVPLTV